MNVNVHVTSTRLKTPRATDGRTEKVVSGKSILVPARIRYLLRFLTFSRGKEVESLATLVVRIEIRKKRERNEKDINYVEMKEA